MPKRRHFGSGRLLLALAILAKPFNIVQPIHAVGFRVALRRSGCGRFGAVRRRRGCECSGGLALCRVARSEGCRAMRAMPWLRAARAVRRHRGCECQGGSSTPDGKIRVLCMIRGVCATKRAPPWQDVRVVYPPAAICRAFRIHGVRILPMPARFGCMAAICCQEGAPFPSEAPFGMHRVKKLPRQGVQGRIAREYCHGLLSGNASRRNPAIARHPRAHSVDILPWPGA